MKKVTIAMVAERAGVSRGTVDRVLNQRPHVSPDQRQRVLDAIRELNYIPSKQRQAAAIAGEEPENRQILLGAIFPDEAGYIRREMMRGTADALRTLKSENVELITEICDTRMADEVAEYMTEMRRKGAQGILLRAEKDERTNQVIAELAEAHIPVITFNSDLPGSRRACFIGQDPAQSGRVAGSLMCRMLRPGDGIIAAIGNQEVDLHRQRLRGFSEVMYRHGFRGDRMHVIETYNDYLLTIQRIGEILREDRDIRGIYMANRSVVGCIEALRREGLSEEVRVIGHDISEATRRIRQLLVSEEVDFIISQNIYMESYTALMTLYRLVRDGVLPEKTIDFNEISIFCAENIGQYPEQGV